MVWSDCSVNALFSMSFFIVLTRGKCDNRPSLCLNYYHFFPIQFVFMIETIIILAFVKKKHKNKDPWNSTAEGQDSCAQAHRWPLLWSDWCLKEVEVKYNQINSADYHDVSHLFSFLIFFLDNINYNNYITMHLYSIFPCVKICETVFHLTFSISTHIIKKMIFLP